jgi:hypothetical protein
MAVVWLLSLIGLWGCEPKPAPVDSAPSAGDSAEDSAVDSRVDGDGDGYTAPADCDDSDPEVSPGADELCNGRDDDCDGLVPESEEDGDGDGWRGCEECDDDDATIHPDAEEICDGRDNNCDGELLAEEDDWDGDRSLECDDCDDWDDTIYPGAQELCDGKDNDCDGAIPASEVDEDGDGALACLDCDDAAPERFPEADEVCDGLDNDCDLQVDEWPIDGEYWYPDADGDGYGDDEVGAPYCSQPPDTIARGGDCDDGDPLINPGAVEVCDDGVDNDCSGLSDCEAAGCAEELYCYESDCEDGEDNDSDGYLDCDDDECWDLDDCGPMMFVTGGHLELWGSRQAVGDRVDRDWLARAEALSGVLVTPLGGVDSSCSWSLRSASFVFSERGLWDDTFRSSLSRAGLETSCEGFGLQAFPQLMDFEPGAVLHRGGLWYAGAVGEGTTTTWVSGSESSFRGSWVIPALDTSEPWRVE